MEKDTFKTKVLFLLDKPEGDFLCDVFAYFPNSYYYGKHTDKNTLTSYASLGQHSACTKKYANECKQATKEQAADLVSELESIGYNLEILNKW